MTMQWHKASDTELAIIARFDSNASLVDKSSAEIETLKRSITDARKGDKNEG